MTLPAATRALVGKLIDHIDPNSPESKRAAILNKLEWHKYTSTEEHVIEQRWKGLKEKLDIYGYESAADNLNLLKIRFLDPGRLITNNPASSRREANMLKYDMLSLLLSLSVSPTRHQHASSLNPSASAHKVTWNDILDDEPLQGDHWQNVDETSGDDDDDLEDAEFDFHRFDKRKRVEPEQGKGGDMDQDDIWYNAAIAGMVDKTNSDKDMSGPRIYWESSMPPRGQYNLDIQSGDRYMLEVDAVRECLFVLRGYQGALFAFDEETQTFEVSSTYGMGHVSQKALGELLEVICDQANNIEELRQWSKRLSLKNTKTVGQTTQAFAVAIHDILLDLEATISELEASERPVVSLLQLQNILSPDFLILETIFDIVHQCFEQEEMKDARMCTTVLLSTLYNRILNAQTAGRTVLYEALLALFSRSLDPFTRLTDDWLFHGSLAGDIAHEFFVSRNNEVKEKDPGFWAEGFRVHHEQNGSDCPIFHPTFVMQVFSAGKVLHLLSHLEPKARRAFSLQPSGGERLLKFLFPQPSTEAPKSLLRLSPHTDAFTKASFPLTQQTEKPVLHLGRVPDEMHLFHQAMTQRLKDYVAEPYAKLTGHLKQVLVDHCGLYDHLRSMSTLYLMLESDLMHTFCESVFIEASDFCIAMARGDTPANDQHVHKLFVDACQASKLPYYNHAKIYLDQTQSTFWDQIQFDYDIPWPLNNFIKHRCCTDYNRIMVFLIRVKRAKYLLERDMFFVQDQVEEGLYAMRIRLMWFVNAFWSYLMTTILYAETLALNCSIRETDDVDEIARLHEDYMRRILDRCLLNDKTASIQKAILRVLDLVDALASRTASIRNIDEQFRRTNTFITTSLTIIARKGALDWMDALAAALSAQ
ncbi:Spc98 family-domain-containing protein [Syncephalastrum racemosum]|uniref:Spindle pole body component n=1 Tax=Syncephalastrum racemosum TaxID=13706 RepID=A0A1X2HQY3_SYNRA|nr:Spc98 family-domain-containing protein [Syncephalastrum racemosum]